MIDEPLPGFKTCFATRLSLEKGLKRMEPPLQKDCMKEEFYSLGWYLQRSMEIVKQMVLYI